MTIEELQQEIDSLKDELRVEKDNVDSYVKENEQLKKELENYKYVYNLIKKEMDYL